MRERRCAGRPRARRCLSGDGAHCMMPACLREGSVDIITLLPEEVEAIRLADLLDLEQEEMAQRMGVSRKTAWKDLHSARKKIADAVINGKALHMESCGSSDNCDCRFVTLNEECADKKCRRRQHGAETPDS
jgi:uncharacterized protein